MRCTRKYVLVTLLLIILILKVAQAHKHHHHDDDDDDDDDHHHKHHHDDDDGDDDDDDDDDDHKHKHDRGDGDDDGEGKIMTPSDEAWLSSVDLSSVPNLPVRLVGSGICEDAKCDGSDNERCFESCGNLATTSDIYGCKKANQWALTFDDGPSPFTENLLDILKEEDVKATFCVTGVHAEKYPHVIQRAYEEGHQIALHTYSHAHLMGLSNEEIIYELKATERAIVDAIGVRPRYLRPPFGEADARVKALAKAMDYKILMWNVDPRDYDIFFKHQSGSRISKHLKKVMDTKITNLNAHNDPGFISLQHDLYELSIEQVPKIIKALRQHGYDMTTVSECIGDDHPFADDSIFAQNATKPTSDDGGHGTFPKDTPSNIPLSNIAAAAIGKVDPIDQPRPLNQAKARPMEASDANSSDKSSSTPPSTSAGAAFPCALVMTVIIMVLATIIAA